MTTSPQRQEIQLIRVATLLGATTCGLVVAAVVFTFIVTQVRDGTIPGGLWIALPVLFLFLLVSLGTRTFLEKALTGRTGIAWLVLVFFVGSTIVVFVLARRATGEGAYVFLAVLAFFLALASYYTRDQVEILLKKPEIVRFYQSTFEAWSTGRVFSNWCTSAAKGFSYDEFVRSPRFRPAPNTAIGEFLTVCMPREGEFLVEDSGPGKPGYPWSVLTSVRYMQSRNLPERAGVLESFLLADISEFNNTSDAIAVKLQSGSAMRVETLQSPLIATILRELHHTPEGKVW
jgi:hypothetical protein